MCLGDTCPGVIVRVDSCPGDSCPNTHKKVTGCPKKGETGQPIIRFSNRLLLPKTEIHMQISNIEMFLRNKGETEIFLIQKWVFD